MDRVKGKGADIIIGGLSMVLKVNKKWEIK
jgi:hypothetical protein